MALRFTHPTRPAIGGLKPGERITERGITAECLADGDTRYSVNLMVDGERIHRVIGRASESVTRGQCEQFIEARRAEAREGRLALPKGRKLHLTFTKAADLYLNQERSVGGKNLISKERHLHLIPYFGRVRLDRISTFTVEKFRNSLRDAGATEGNIIRILATYSRMGRRLAEWKVTPRPLPMIMLKQVKTGASAS